MRPNRHDHALRRRDFHPECAARDRLDAIDLTEGRRFQLQERALVFESALAFLRSRHLVAELVRPEHQGQVHQERQRGR